MMKKNLIPVIAVLILALVSPNRSEKSVENSSCFESPIVRKTEKIRNQDFNGTIPEGFLNLSYYSLNQDILVFSDDLNQSDLNRTVILEKNEENCLCSAYTVFQDQIFKKVYSCPSSLFSNLQAKSIVCDESNEDDVLRAYYVEDNFYSMQSMQTTNKMRSSNTVQKKDFPEYTSNADAVYEFTGSYGAENGYSICQNSYKQILDSQIVNVIPKELFSKKGQTISLGHAYGFFINTYEFHDSLESNFIVFTYDNASITHMRISPAINGFTYYDSSCDMVCGFHEGSNLALSNIRMAGKLQNHSTLNYGDPGYDTYNDNGTFYSSLEYEFHGTNIKQEAIADLQENLDLCKNAIDVFDFVSSFFNASPIVSAICDISETVLEITDKVLEFKKNNLASSVKDIKYESDGSLYFSLEEKKAEVHRNNLVDDHGVPWKSIEAKVPYDDPYQFILTNENHFVDFVCFPHCFSGLTDSLDAALCMDLSIVERDSDGYTTVVEGAKAVYCINAKNMVPQETISLSYDKPLYKLPMYSYYNKKTERCKIETIPLFSDYYGLKVSVEHGSEFLPDLSECFFTLNSGKRLSFSTFDFIVPLGYLSSRIVMDCELDVGHAFEFKLVKYKGSISENPSYPDVFSSSLCYDDGRYFFSFNCPETHLYSINVVFPETNFSHSLQCYGSDLNEIQGYKIGDCDHQELYIYLTAGKEYFFDSTIIGELDSCAYQISVLNSEFLVDEKDEFDNTVNTILFYEATRSEIWLTFFNRKNGRMIISGTFYQSSLTIEVFDYNFQKQSISSSGLFYVHSDSIYHLRVIRNDTGSAENIRLSLVRR